MNHEVFEAICKEIETSSLGLKHICKNHNVARSTVTDYIRENKEAADRYARAKEMQMDYLAEEILDISDDGSNDLMTIVKGDEVYEQENKEVVNRSKLRVDSRKWLMSKLAPKKYGDKLETTIKGDADAPVHITGMVIK
jgi:predicted DNA-binding protein YlxM (UPF0122 family)